MNLINTGKAAISYLGLAFIATNLTQSHKMIGNLISGGNFFLTIFELIDALYLIHFKRYSKFNLLVPIGNMTFWIGQLIAISGKGTEFESNTDLLGLALSLSTLIPSFSTLCGIYPKKEEEVENGTRYFYHPFKVVWKCMRVFSWAVCLKLPIFKAVPSYLINYLAYPLLFLVFFLGTASFACFERCFKPKNEGFHPSLFERILNFFQGIFFVLGTGYACYALYSIGLGGNNFELGVERTIWEKINYWAWALTGIGSAYGYQKLEDFASQMDWDV